MQCIKKKKYRRTLCLRIWNFTALTAKLAKKCPCNEYLWKKRAPRETKWRCAHQTVIIVLCKWKCKREITRHVRVKNDFDLFRLFKYVRKISQPWAGSRSSWNIWRMAVDRLISCSSLLRIHSARLLGQSWHTTEHWLVTRSATHASDWSHYL